MKIWRRCPPRLPDYIPGRSSSSNGEMGWPDHDRHLPLLHLGVRPTLNHLALFADFVILKRSKETRGWLLFERMPGGRLVAWEFSTLGKQERKGAGAATLSILSRQCRRNRGSGRLLLQSPAKTMSSFMTSIQNRLR